MNDSTAGRFGTCDAAVLAAVLDSVSVVLFTLDRAGRFVASKGRGLERTGLEAGELVGRSAYDVFGDLDFVLDDGTAVPVPELLPRLLAGESVSGLTRFASRVFHNRLSPAPEDLPAAVVGVALDVTERAAAEDELSRSEKMLSSVLECMEGAVFVVGPEHRRITHVCNSAVERLLGYAPHELEGGTTEKLHVDRRAFERFAELGEPELDATGRFTTEYQTKCKDGSIIDTYHSLSVLDRERGWRGGVVSVVHDITARKRAERELRRSEQRFRRAFDEAPVGAVLLAPDLRIRRANAVFQELSGSSQEDLQEMMAVELTHPEDVDPTVTERVLKGGSVRGLIRRYLRKDGGVFWGRVSAGAIRDRGGRPVEVLAMVEDISEMVHTSQELERALGEVRSLTVQLTETEQAERRALSRELHDAVGQDLASLSLNLGLVRRQLDDQASPELDARLAESLKIVEEVGERVRDVMAELRPPMLDDFGLSPTLRWVGRRFADRSGLIVRVRTNEPEPRLGSAAETTLLRVAQEALANVEKHAAGSRVTITLHSRPELVRLSITDDGRGFVPDRLPSATSGGGWGIVGMRERVEALGGSFRIDSALQRGTRVVAELGR